MKNEARKDEYEYEGEDRRHQEPEDTRMHLSPTVSLGHLISTATFIIAGIWYAAKIDSQIAQTQLMAKANTVAISEIKQYSEELLILRTEYNAHTESQMKHEAEQEERQHEMNTSILSTLEKMNETMTDIRVQFRANKGR
ncbi:MAG: hypothetical protein R8K20_10455 [Gallionellaceae bacterium]